jgi:hypothetical protein
VKILLDESVPRVLKLRLPQFDISTVQEMGWAGIQNGELLRRAEELFDVFVTAYHEKVRAVVRMQRMAAPVLRSRGRHVRIWELEMDESVAKRD